MVKPQRIKAGECPRCGKHVGMGRIYCAEHAVARKRTRRIMLAMKQRKRGLPLPPLEE